KQAARSGVKQPGNAWGASHADSNPLLCRYGKHVYGYLPSPLFLVKQQSARCRSEPASRLYSVCAAVVDHRSCEHFYNTRLTYSAVIQIGRASCRERMKIQIPANSIKKKT